MADSFDRDDDSQDEDKEDEKILADALARFKLVAESENDIRRDALDDLRFASGEQWDQKIRADRENDRRPCLTINRIPQFIKQITNDQRQNRPAIKAHPVDDQADVETAKAISGLIRHIEYNSNADAAYDTAFDGAVRAGRGFIRVITDYSDPLSFDQEILIKRIRNPLSVFLDPFSQEPDGSDARFAFITDDIAKDEYLKSYPESRLAKSGEWNATGNDATDWINDKSVRIAEYFYKDAETKNLALLNDGRVVIKDELTEELPEGVEIVSERQSDVPVIKWCKLNGSEILEKRIWAGQYIPIVPVYGEELDINGKRILKGIVRDSKDAQRMYNFWKSSETEAISLAPKTPWVAEEGQIEGYEQDWQSANRKNHAVLKYKAKSVNGQPIAPPQRQAFEPAVQAITNAAMMAADDLKSTTGIYDASLGAQSNETSGVAIQRRNNQAQTSNFHFVDNLTRSLRHTGRILIDLIPKIYDSARTARIIGEDGEQKVIKINQAFDQDGKPTLYDLSVGKYDVTIDVGPSYASKRQEAAASMISLSQAVPEIVKFAGDIMIRNMDWPGAQEIADRLKKTLPPGLADDPNKQTQIPPQVQAQMQQMGQMIDQMTAQLHKLSDEREQKFLEYQHKERIEYAKLKTQAEIELAKIDAKDGIALLNAQINEIEAKIGRIDAFVSDPVSQAPQQNLQQQPQPQFAPQPNGAQGADLGQGAQNPTGGASPGSPMEGN